MGNAQCTFVVQIRSRIEKEPKTKNKKNCLIFKSGKKGCASLQTLQFVLNYYMKRTTTTTKMISLYLPFPVLPAQSRTLYRIAFRNKTIGTIQFMVNRYILNIQKVLK